jgi:hypothetical protein
MADGLTGRSTMLRGCALWYPGPLFKTSDIDMRTHWLVQTNIGPLSGVADLLAALRAEGASFTEVEALPFTDTPPTVAIPDGHLALVYGTTNLVDVVSRHRPWTPGVFFDPAQFTYTAWAVHYGAHLLNSPDETVRTTLGQVLNLALPQPDVFVRPERDLKEFNGAVWETDRFLAFAREVLEKGGFPQLNADTPIVMGVPHGIAAEWRTFITDEGEIIGASQYRKNGKVCHDAHVPDDVLAFAQARAREWSPAPIFVLDVARSGEGLFVVEAQCAHSAGFYATELRPWVRGMERVMTRWAKNQASAAAA